MNQKVVGLSSLALLKVANQIFPPRHMTCCGVSILAFRTDETPGGFRDYQEVKVQEQVQKLDVGKVSSITVWPLLVHVTMVMTDGHSLTQCSDSTLHVGDS